MSYSEQALAELQKNDLEKAKHNFNLALRHDDDNTIYSLGEELYALGFLRQARRVFEKLLQKYPDEDELRTKLADIDVSDGKTDAAIELLAAIKPESDAYAEALLTSADVYQTMGLYEVSEQKLLEGLRRYPDEPVMKFALGELYSVMGDYQKASGYYETLLDDGVTEMANVQIEARLGAAYAGSGQYEDAIAAYEKMPQIALTPDDQFQLGFLYLQIKEYERSIKILEQLRQSNPDYSSLYTPLAQGLMHQQKLAEALQVVQQGLGVDDFNEVLALLGGQIAIQLHQTDVAEKLLKKALTINSESMAATLALSQLYLDQERDDENIALLKQLNEQGDVNPQVHWNLAISQARLEQDDAAEENYLLAYDAFKDNTDFLRQLITFFQARGKRTETLAALKRYVKLAPEDLEMQNLLDDYQNES
ncbi:tetratricopeptide repeat protein [Lactobacillus selangorensis]|uniref:tetratricopeptide repeat protein n=1 Tax=Lactobacillus selangorensis TaxID=81857 RepID=UPI000B034056|nr:tetratricopeptide repeat protein [Lactobacillus selangorensis]